MTKVQEIIEKLGADGLQEIENEAQDMGLKLLSIGNAEAEQLKEIASLVGANTGTTDTETRRYIRAQVAANLSSGTLPDMVDAWTLTTGFATAAVIDSFPAQIILEYPYGETISNPSELLAFMQRVAAEGVLIYGIRESSDIDDTDEFFRYAATTGTTSVTAGYGAGKYRGFDVIAVSETDDTTYTTD